jgi:hypothetical protein
MKINDLAVTLDGLTVELRPSSYLHGPGRAEAVRNGMDRVKRERGREAVRRQWQRLCSQQVEAARDHRRATMTAADLLRCRKTRDELYRIVRERRKYSKRLDDHARRKVIAEARQRLADRERRRSDRRIAEDARTANPGRIARRATCAAVARRLGDPDRRHKRSWIRRQLLRADVRKHLSADEIAAASQRCSLGRRQRAEIVRDLCRREQSERTVRLLAAQIGTIGKQAERDLAEFVESESLDGKRGKNHYYTRSSVKRVQIRRDLTAALVTMTDYRSWGAYGYGGADGYGKQGGVSFRAYLIVRDSTTGEAHIMRVRPRYGNAETNYYHDIARLSHKEWRGMSDGLRRRMRRATDAERRIHAAVAWTFHLRAGQYDPQIEA